jgi:photosystem II stability/assembly factor-like uncharacterized protein
VNRGRVGVTALIVVLILAVSCWIGVGKAAALVSYESMSFVDAQHGWLSGTVDPADPSAIVDETLWKTDDGGASWTWVASTPRYTVNSTCVAFTSPSTGLWWNYLGLSGTTTSGQAWQAVQGQLPSVGDVHFVNAALGWVAGGGQHGGYGSVCKTTDGGLTWQRELYRSTGRQDGAGFGSVSAPTGRCCYVLGATAFKSVWSTRDGGAHWVRHKLPRIPDNDTYGVTLPSSYWDIAFPTALRGWAVGDLGTIVKTTNGGRAWKKVPCRSTLPFNAVAFSDARHGFIVGDGGLLWRTSDGGTHWMTKEIGLSDFGMADDLTAVTFVDSRHGWIIDDLSDAGSVLLRTTDGGKTWR